MPDSIAGAAMMEPEEPQLPEEPKADPQPEGPSFFETMLKAETGPGEIEEYVNHPLNFTHELGLAQLIRGLTGMFGSLSLAIIDVAMGGIRMLRDRRPKPEVPNVSA